VAELWFIGKADLGTPVAKVPTLPIGVETLAPPEICGRMLDANPKSNAKPRHEGDASEQPEPKSPLVTPAGCSDRRPEGEHCGKGETPRSGEYVVHCCLHLRRHHTHGLKPQEGGGFSIQGISLSHFLISS
jgi:hypothetical protein